MDGNKTLERAEIIAALLYCASDGQCSRCPTGWYDGVTCTGFAGMLRTAAALLERDAEPPNKPPTNADRIRAMSDEELAVTLMCPNEMGMADIPCDHSDNKNCCLCLLDWLQQPAPEEGEQHV